MILLLSLQFPPPSSPIPLTLLPPLLSSIFSSPLLPYITWGGGGRIMWLGCWSSSSHEPSRLDQFQFSNTHIATATNSPADLPYDYGYTVIVCAWGKPCTLLVCIWILKLLLDIAGLFRKTSDLLIMVSFVSISYIQNILFFHPSPIVVMLHIRLKGIVKMEKRNPGSSCQKYDWVLIYRKENAF